MSKQKKRKRARVQIAVDEQGKPVYKWANGYTKAELEASKTKIRIEYGVDQMIKFPVIKKESPPENKCETFSAYASRWFALYKEPHVRASTKAMYDNGFNAHIFPAIGSRPLDEITADELQAFVIGFSESSASLIDKIMLILRQVFAAAQADGLIEKNPVARLKPPAGTTGERLPLPIKDVEALVKAARIHPYGLFPLLLLFTGLSVTALAAGTGPAAATPTPTVASAFEPSNGEISGFDFSIENVVIPASINGVTVTKIGQSAFLYTGLDSGISTIVVPSTVTFVGDYAFGYNELLECDLFLTEKVRR